MVHQTFQTFRRGLQTRLNRPKHTVRQYLLKVFKGIQRLLGRRRRFTLLISQVSLQSTSDAHRQFVEVYKWSKEVSRHSWTDKVCWIISAEGLQTQMLSRTFQTVQRGLLMLLERPRLFVRVSRCSSAHPDSYLRVSRCCWIGPDFSSISPSSPK